MKNPRGTSLVEIIVYFAIVGVVLFAIMIFAIQIYKLSNRSTNYNEVQTNLDLISDQIISNIQYASSVDNTASVFDSDEGALSLLMPNPSNSPTKIYMEGQNILISKGIGSPIQLNSDFVLVKSLRFHKVSAPKSPDQIIIDAVLAPNDAKIVQQQRTLTLHVSVSLRTL